jgi:putative endonuclease
VYYVYVLLCADGIFYTGFSSDLRRRVREHESGEVFSTRGRLPVKLVFYEAFLKEADARRRETYLKTSSGKRALKLMMREFLGTLK